jgi:hypothetical protein
VQCLMLVLFVAFDHLVHTTDMYVAYTPVCLARMGMPERLRDVASELSVSELRLFGIPKQNESYRIVRQDSVKKCICSGSL